MNLKIGDQVFTEIGPGRIKIKSIVIEIYPGESKPYKIRCMSPDGVSRTQRIEASDIIEKAPDD